MDRLRWRDRQARGSDRWMDERIGQRKIKGQSDGYREIDRGMNINRDSQMNRGMDVKTKERNR